MHWRLGFAVGLMTLGGLALNGGHAWAGDTRATSPASGTTQGTTSTREATAPSGTVDISVNVGGTYRLYRFDRATGKLTLVRELSAREAASVTASFRELKLVESQVAARGDNGTGTNVQPEGKPPPKGGPPGGTDPGGLLQVDLDNLNRELTLQKLDTTQVKLGSVQAASTP